MPTTELVLRRLRQGSRASRMATRRSARRAQRRQSAALLGRQQLGGPVLQEGARPLDGGPPRSRPRPGPPRNGARRRAPPRTRKGARRGADDGSVRAARTCRGARNRAGFGAWEHLEQSPDQPGGATYCPRRARAPQENRPIASWKAGDLVQGFAFLRRKETRQDKGAALTSTSSWSTRPARSRQGLVRLAALAADFTAPGYVKFRGQVQSYRDQIQLQVENCRAVIESDAPTASTRRSSSDTKYDIGELWTRLEETLAGQLVRPEAARLAEETLALHGAALRLHPAARRSTTPTAGACSSTSSRCSGWR